MVQLAAGKYLKKYLASWASLSIGGLILFFIFLHQNNLNIPFIRDEGEYAYSAWLFRKNIPPYQNSFLQKPPMIIYTYGLAQLINPYGFWPPRLLACLFIAASSILLELISRREFGKGAGLISMWLFAPMVLLPELDQFTANTEKFMLLPLLGTLAFLILKKNELYKWQWPFLGGILSAITLLYKYTAFPIISFIFAVWLIEIWTSHRNLKKLLKTFFFWLLGGVSASILILAYFLWLDRGKSLWEATITFNKYYSQSAIFNFEAFVSYLKLFLRSWWILFLLLFWFIARRPRRSWFYLALFILATATTYGSWYGHYYLILMPFWALIAASSLNDLSQKISEALSINKRWVRITLTGLTVFLIIWPSKNYLSLSQKEFQNKKYSGGNPFLESPLVAKRVSEITSAHDYVFIAGSEPQILYYAQRQSSSRFVIVYPLMIETPLALKYQEEAIEELKSHPPKVIIWANSPYSWTIQEKSPRLILDYLKTLLEEKYLLVGGFIQEESARHWQEPLTKEGEMKSTLLLFKAKEI